MKQMKNELQQNRTAKAYESIWQQVTGHVNSLTDQYKHLLRWECLSKHPLSTVNLVNH